MGIGKIREPAADERMERAVAGDKASAVEIYQDRISCLP
jgi:hypothetical protein